MPEIKTQNLSNDTVFIDSNDIVVSSEQNILDLIGETEFKHLVLHEYNFDADFFDLSTKKLGNILQKLTNYHVNLAIVGDFSKYSSTVLPDFIRESNKQRKYIFVGSLDEVKTLWDISYP